MGFFRKHYIFFQFVVLLCIGFGVYRANQTAKIEQDLLQQLKASQNLQPAAISDDTREHAANLLKDAGLTPPQSSDLATLVAKDLAQQMANDPQGEVKKSIDSFSQSVAAHQSDPEMAQKAKAIKKPVEDAIRRAAGVLGLSADVTEKVVDKLTSWPGEAVAAAGKVVFEEIIKDAYRFTRDLILGTRETSVVCKCCSETPPEKQPRDHGGVQQPPPPEGQPPTSQRPAAESARQLVVYFRSSESKISSETQVEQLWRARAMFFQAKREPKAAGPPSQLHLHLHGYTDTTGSDRFNRGLRERRARAVQDALYQLLPNAKSNFGSIVIDSTEGQPPPVAVVGKAAIPSNRAVVIDFGE